MLRNLTLLTISVLLFCSAQCSREETPAPNNGGIQPEWEVRIPTKKSPYIYWEGLNYIYKYGDCIIAHTSFYGDSENEDNRLCGINEKTKEIEWFFPSDTSKRYDYIFRSKAYQYKNMLLFKYSDNDYSESAKVYNVCFDLSSKKVIWEMESGARDAEIIEGFDNTCYFSTNGHEVNRISLDNLSVEKIFDSDSTKVSDFKISTNKQHINSPLVL